MTDYRPAEFGHLPWLLKLAEREVGKELDRELRHTGITKSQFGVLQALVHLTQASSAALARTVFVTPQAMVNIVSELERKGFIKRRASPASARVIEAAVTPAGRAVFEEGSKAIRNVDDLLAGEFSERELERFVQYLERCVSVLQESREP